MEKAEVESAVLMADEALQEMMKKHGYRIYSGGGQRYAKAVAHLAATILIVDAKKTE